MNKYYPVEYREQTPFGFKSIRLPLSKPCSLFRDTLFVANDPIERNNAINTDLINLNSILY